MSMKQLKATERQLESIRNLCHQRNLPTTGTTGVQHMYQFNEQLKHTNPAGYEGAKDFINKCFEYIRKTKT